MLRVLCDASLGTQSWALLATLSPSSSCHHVSILNKREREREKERGRESIINCVIKRLPFLVLKANCVTHVLLFACKLTFRILACNGGVCTTASGEQSWDEKMK